MDAAPDELACFCQIFRSAFDRREGVAVSVAYFGALEDGRELVRELTDRLTPVGSSVRPMYYAELQEVFGRQPFGLRNYASEASGDLETEFGGARLERLRAVKRRFDPDNVFRFNHNVVP